MAFSSLQDFLAMGGHGIYVWLAYAAGLIVFSYNLVSPTLAKRYLFRRLQQQIRREQSTSQTPKT